MTRLPEAQAYLDAAEVALLIGVTPRSVRSWHRSGKHGFPPPCRYLGDRPKWRRSDIVAWMEPQEAAHGTT